MASEGPLQWLCVLAQRLAPFASRVMSQIRHETENIAGTQKSGMCMYQHPHTKFSDCSVCEIGIVLAFRCFALSKEYTSEEKSEVQLKD